MCYQREVEEMTREQALQRAFDRAYAALQPYPSSCWTDPTTGDRRPFVMGVGRSYGVTPLRIEWDPWMADQIALCPGRAVRR